MKIYTDTVAKIRRLPFYVKQMSNAEKIKAVAILFIIVALIALVISRISSGQDEISFQQLREVEIKNVALLSSEQSALNLIGKVRSQTEATIRTEASGEIVGVYQRVGNFIGAGTVIAEIKNSSERALVLQAEGSVDQARASLQKIEGGTRDEQLSILEITAANSKESYESAKIATVNDLISVYADIDDAIRRKADQTFSNPGGERPIFDLLTSDFQLVTQVESNRIEITKIINRESLSHSIISTEIDLAAEIATTKEELLFITKFLEDLTLALNKAIPTASITESVIDSFRLDVSSARTSVNSLLSKLSATLDNLNNKKASLDIAEKNLELGLIGERAEDVAVGKASLKQAEGRLRSAQAGLEKTLLRSPISGTINTLSVERGDFVSMFELAATVSNNKALEIQAFITEEDKREIEVGGTVIVAKAYRGTVTSIAPGLDPITRKIEVKIKIEDSDVNLTHGTSVRISINRATASASTDIERILIPLSALKVEASRIVVFTVDATQTLTAHEIIEGLIVGEKIIIESGLTPDMYIVTDARGLKEGQKVTLKN